MRVYFQHEAPRIGCGWRNVEVIRRGPKWVTVRYAPLPIRKKRSRKARQPITVVNQKFPAHVWAGIERYARN